jgi:hypothetical protein
VLFWVDYLWFYTVLGGLVFHVYVACCFDGLWVDYLLFWFLTFILFVVLTVSGWIIYCFTRVDLGGLVIVLRGSGWFGFFTCILFVVLMVLGEI